MRKTGQGAWILSGLLTAIGLAAPAAPAAPAAAEVAEIRISKGYSIGYLPLVIMQQKKLLESEAAKLGISNLNVTWLLIDGGSQVNDAMLAGAVDIAATGLPGLVTLWAKAKGDRRSAVIGVTSISSFPLYLNSRNPEVKSIDDFTDKDRIGMPSIKTSLAAGILQMAVAKNNGVENYAKLDPITVGIPQPDGMAALLSGKSGITAHFTSPPFSYIELEDPHIHRVLSSVDVMGHTSLALAFSTRRFVDANPILCKAFLGAVEEADAFIQAHPDETADIFARTSDVKVTPELARKIMANPDTVYTSVPSGMQTYLDFMYSIGILKTKAQSWKELFAGDILNKNGS